MTTWFEGLSLPVTDLERSVRFYGSLGFVEEIRNGGFALLRFDGATLGLLEARAAVGRLGAAAALVQVELGTDDLDGRYAELVAAGIEVRVPPRDRGFERSMQLRDPDGFTVEFAEGVRGHNATR
ncbi:VOC family protein [Actinomycetospora chiangmaiensis]|uniref:VOC family protein n=1 Tax=Actinomycetospora chiangmaiensis TaxID=402650 RepID=UPI00036B27D7|nr:VOC family protein [Actinomycetospora chiangmaiensis]